MSGKIEAIEAAARAVYEELPHVPGVNDEQFYLDLAHRIATVSYDAIVSFLDQSQIPNQTESGQE